MVARLGVSKAVVWLPVQTLGLRRAWRGAVLGYTKWGGSKFRPRWFWTGRRPLLQRSRCRNAGTIFLILVEYVRKIGGKKGCDFAFVMPIVNCGGSSCCPGLFRFSCRCRPFRALMIFKRNELQNYLLRGSPKAAQSSNKGISSSIGFDVCDNAHPIGMLWISEGTVRLGAGRR